MSFSHLRSRLHRRKESGKENKAGSQHEDDMFFEVKEVKEDDSASLNGSVSSQFSNSYEKQVYEDHLTQIEEQLVSVMIENQNLAQELKQYKENAANEQLRRELEEERARNKALHNQLQKSGGASSGRGSGLSNEPRRLVERTPNLTTGQEVLPPEDLPSEGGSRVDKMWDRVVEMLYNAIENFNDMTRPEVTKEQPVEPLSVKTLKENIRRFKLGIKPITDTVKGLQNLLSWKSRSYTLIVFIIYMFIVWRGWFLPLMFFLGALRMVVNYLHFKGYKFHFAYLDPGEMEKDTDDTLRLSEKFNLVLLVATKVQNGLGSAADGLEKIKNLLTWRHYEGSKRVLSMLCIACVASAVVPSSYLWKFMGIGFGIKLFFINYLYSKYPRIRKRYDSSYRLWQTLPTDAEYDKIYVKTEMNKYIVVPKCDGEMEKTVDGDDTDTSTVSDEDDSSAEFRLVFSLPITECPLTGWLRGKRAVLIGKDRSLITLLAKKRGKLFLTKSFLCFEREKLPSAKNIVIPLQDIVSIEKVKINQRMPGKGLTMQILISSDWKENVLHFGGIIRCSDVIKNIEQAIKAVKREKQLSPPSARGSSLAMSRSFPDSMSSRIQTFTFGAYYDDSD